MRSRTFSAEFLPYVSTTKTSLRHQYMTEGSDNFELEARSSERNDGPQTEELDSGDYFHAPERHWLVRFSVVIFCVGLLAGASATSAVSNQWIAFSTSVICLTLSALCTMVFFGVLWRITLRELQLHSKTGVELRRYWVTSLYFWCGLIVTILGASLALYYVVFQK